MNEIVHDLSIIFEKNKSSQKAIEMSAYMKNKFDFLGIKSSLRRELQKEAMSAISKVSLSEFISIVNELWEMPFREYQYCVCEILERYANKLPASYITQFERLITSKSWWDSVDGIAPRSLGIFLKNYPFLIEENIKCWVESSNIWLKRSAILFQLKYKKFTNQTILFQIIKSLSKENEFFIRKAIGWALREYSKTNPKAVLKFVEFNDISILSKREALKIILEKE